jgi:hypothetical protein
MKAKLIKIDKDNYTLFDEKGIPIGTTPNVLSNNTFSKLSKQNCDEIFGVVSVEKLAEEYKNKKGSISTTELEDEIFKLGFKDGFNKAMELNKDKLFTLEDIKKAINLAYVIGKSDDTYQECEKFVCEQLQSIKQPTEIEVEIEMEKIVDETKVMGAVKGVKGSGDKITTYKSVPKLDSQGNLILKKI